MPKQTLEHHGGPGRKSIEDRTKNAGGTRW